MKKMLLIGGSGIVGTGVIESARDNYQITVAAKDPIPDNDINYISIDRSVSSSLKKELRGNWDVALDICAYNDQDSKKLYDSIKDKIGHIFILSTTLVYDRSKLNFSPIRSSHPLAKIGSQGGYVDSKLSLEGFWQSVCDLPWTIVRPYHILGKHSLLGCVPPTNRDPNLVMNIELGCPISLPDRGRLPLNIISPKDIGSFVSIAANNPKTFFKKYNILNPQEILVRDYYEEIARQLGKRLKIKYVSSESLWKNQIGWTLTLLPHLYDVSDLIDDTGFKPNLGLQQCISDSLQSYNGNSLVNMKVHRNMNLTPVPKRNPYYE